MYDMKISDSVVFIGVNDKTIDLFESQYKVPKGVSYNSYVILDEKVAVMDTVDKRATDPWLENLDKALDGRSVDYLVISHLEPDHASNIQRLAEKYPEMKLVGNAKIFSMLPQFFDFDFSERKVVVKEGDTLSLGSHTLQFFMAPMVHWPEVMVEYEQSEKILFSADGFGKFGSIGRRRGLDRRSQKIFYQYCRKIRCAGTELIKESGNFGYSDYLPAARTDFKRKSGILY